MKASLKMPDKYAGMTGAERSWALNLEAALRSGTNTKYASGRPVENCGASNSAVVHWLFEPLAFRLAKGTTYRPDFCVLYSDGHVELHEVKQEHRGLKQSQNWKTSIAKFKVAADLFPEFDWYVCMKRLDGSWSKTHVDDLFKRT